MSEELVFQHEEPKEGELVVGVVVHIVRLKEIREKGLHIIGYVVPRKASK